MTQKEQILKLIESEKLRVRNIESSFSKRYFLSKMENRWYDGIIYGLEELECLIESELESFESFEIMLNELNSLIELNKIRNKTIERLKDENIKLKKDLIKLTTKNN